MTGTTSITQERFHPAQGCTTNSSTVGSHLQQGLTNLEYKGTQQDLIDEKERLQGYASLRGIKVSL
jgi:hypothetical protein